VELTVHFENPFEGAITRKEDQYLDLIAETRKAGYIQWQRKIVELRGAEARRRAALPCFSPANIKLFIAMNSLDDSLLLSWVHSESLPSDSDKLSTSTLQSYTSFNPTLVC